MKTPSSRPRFQSATRHYHRYREENPDGWSDWVEGSKKPRKPGGPGRKKWIVIAVLGTGVASLLAAAAYNFF